MSNLERLPPDFLKTFIRHINMLRFIGLDMFYEINKSFVTRYTRFSIFNVLFIPMVIGQVLYVVYGSNTDANLLDVANAVPTTFMALQDTVKMIVIFSKRKEIECVIMGIAEIWPTKMESDRKKKSFNNWLRRLNTMDDIFFRCSIAWLFIYEMAPFVITVHGVYGAREAAQYLYPLQWYFARWVRGRWQYALVYFYLLTTSVTAHMVLYISTDFLLVTMTFNLSTLLDLLQIDLEDAVQRYDFNVEQSIQDVKDIVARHHKILWLAKELKSIFGLLVFVQMSFSSIIICCFGFLTIIAYEGSLTVSIDYFNIDCIALHLDVMFDDDDIIAEGTLLSNLFASVGVSVAVWNLCWPGQLLVDTSFGVSEAAYRSEWYNKDAEFRKHIVIIMSRAQRPCYLTALGFSNLTLTNFFKILSTSWSYLSLLNQMYQDSEA